MFRVFFFSPFPSFNDEKLRYKYQNKGVTTRDNGNVQFNDKKESKLNSAIIANNTALTLTHDKIIKSPFSQSNAATKTNIKSK